MIGRPHARYAAGKGPVEHGERWQVRLYGRSHGFGGDLQGCAGGDDVIHRNQADDDESVDDFRARISQIMNQLTVLGCQYKEKEIVL
jgi:hypothetical protein